MAYCPQCKGEMDALATVCPHCKYDFPDTEAEQPAFRQTNWLYSSFAQGVLSATQGMSGLAGLVGVIAGCVHFIHQQWATGVLVWLGAIMALGQTIALGRIKDMGRYP